MNDTPDEPSLLSIARDGNDMESPVEALNLGERVRELRKARNWTLEQAAKKAGLARSTLSKIENHQMSPTFEAVQKLAQGLDISIPQLFTPPKADKVLARRAITRAGEGQAHPTRTYEHEILASEMRGKKMLPYRAIVRARSFDDFDGWVRHDGEEFLYVLSGIVEFYSEFYAPVRLKRGDSAYYDAAMGHNVISVSEDDATILWVTGTG
ncbi:helix-turn-helix domain-containing protein [Oceanibium sediminis]|uniref:helix-turn-helix domain-containing protein n=1 Tax=Oceanibium sediminis TaxID=2026339 RepID=UPI000DD455B4|nr:XRE family transcriptional regulator [Oceanibium sediminis]